MNTEIKSQWSSCVKTLTTGSLAGRWEHDCMLYYSTAGMSEMLLIKIYSKYICKYSKILMFYFDSTNIGITVNIDYYKWPAPGSTIMWTLHSFLLTFGLQKCLKWISYIKQVKCKTWFQYKLCTTNYSFIHSSNVFTFMQWLKKAKGKNVLCVHLRRGTRRQLGEKISIAWMTTNKTKNKKQKTHPLQYKILDKKLATL